MDTQQLRTKRNQSPETLSGFLCVREKQIDILARLWHVIHPVVSQRMKMITPPSPSQQPLGTVCSVRIGGMHPVSFTITDIL